MSEPAESFPADPAGRLVLRVETRATGELSEAELGLIARQRARIDYGMPAWGYQYAPKVWRTLAWVGQEVVGHAGIVPRTVAVDGRPIAVGGISGVWTAPEHRRRGVGRAVMAAAAAFMRDELGAAFGLLLCLPELEPFYQRLGWRGFPGPLVFEQPGRRITWPLSVMVLPWAPGTEWPRGTIDLRGLPW
ncbi:MAG TPA: GNAT family N-acetyltransferase [Chloroflexota bacterium]|jgi:aminoglycoside 2'-N-acetyltransferase I|nr:GNAT family N-acetyltransferase [Chloroflexota bacterium]